MEKNKKQANKKLEEKLKQKEEELAKLKEELEIKENEAKDSKDRLLRFAAEAENMKKRLEKEKKEFFEYANESLLKDILPLIDNLERAIQHANENSNIEEFIKGIELSINSFKNTLEKYGVEEVESLHKPFDPNYHEAMSTKETDEFPPNTVVEEFQKGYTFKQRLLRPALVCVSKEKK
jgi:molecular chaperone GrpE